MSTRILKRKVIIREYDFKKVAEQATGLFYDGTALYDRVSWMPLNAENLEKIKVMDILKGKKNTPILDAELDLKYPGVLVAQLRDYLYNPQYYRWKVTMDEEGYLCVQSRKNTPKTRLGWGVFEKDLTCRI